MEQHRPRLRARFGSRKPRTSAPEFLLIDVSNSFTKLAFSSASKIGRPIRIRTRELTSAVIRKLLRRQNARTLVVSSVVPAKNRAISNAAGEREVIWVNSKAKLNIRIEYPHPTRIGADRIANAVAVTALYGAPAIVVDFGTAVTFDVVSSSGAYIGGVIAPGLEAMTSFLFHRTALLPKLSLREPPRTIGKSTREAMLAGAVFGYRGLVKAILERITREGFRRQRPRVIVTGGYATLLARDLREIETVHENLTLEGLRLIGQLNRRGSC